MTAQERHKASGGTQNRLFDTERDTDHDSFICRISEMLYLPKGEEMAGGKRSGVYGQTHQRRQPDQRGIDGMAETKRSSGEALL